jgi:hypothetical protein
MQSGKLENYIFLQKSTGFHPTKRTHTPTYPNENQFPQISNFHCVISDFKVENVLPTTD